MRGDELHECVRARAEQLLGAELDHPFGPEWDVFKVRGKIFALLTELGGELVVNLKAHPDDADALRSTFAEIIPGYHMNKKHWITVRPGDAITADLVDELVTESYLLVVATLPRARRPLN